MASIKNLLANLKKLPDYGKQLVATAQSEAEAKKAEEMLKQAKKKASTQVSPSLISNVKNVAQNVVVKPITPTPMVSNPITKQSVIQQPIKGLANAVAEPFNSINVQEEFASAVLKNPLEIYTKYKTERNMGVKPLTALSNAANSLIGDREKTAYTNQFLSTYNKEIKKGTEKNKAIELAKSSGKQAEIKEQVRPFMNFIMSSGNIKPQLGPEASDEFNKYMADKYGKDYIEKQSLVNIKKDLVD
jgi:hypothetical protein